MLRADLALVGFGRVGGRFAELFTGHREWLRRELHLDCRIVGVATATHGSVFNPDGIDPREAASRRAAGSAIGRGGSPLDMIAQLRSSDADIKVMIETTTLSIRDGQPAIAHIEAAVGGGCHSITANKGPVAFAYRRLRDRAERAGVSFLFEGAVMDGVPIFNLVRETMPGVAVTGFRGVVNTTTQHILVALERGERFEDALARMQAEGIAETDPTLDVDGWDAAAKAAALANVLLDGDLTPQAVDREGLGPATADAAQSALKRERRLRLVASGSRQRGTVRASVRLTEIERHDVLAALPSVGNALVLSTDLLDDIAICQLGGNITQTAYALLSDLVTVGRRAAAART